MPGGVAAKHWSYLQVVIGYVIGYWVVAGVLLPLYYKLQLTSIYGYLKQRFGEVTYRTGASFFILSRTLGATIRIYLVLHVLHLFVLAGLGVPFWLTSAVVLLMIVLYTLRGGVKTIVWTDTLQTLFMLAALVGTVVFITQQDGMANWSTELSASGMLQVFNTDWRSDGFFMKQILSGIFITIAMTGLDQEMMQKNLSVRTVGDAQKNMRVFSVILLGVNMLFLLLGALFYLHVQHAGIKHRRRGDDLFPTLALQHFPPWLGLLFIIGLISALFPSADGALTALTASTCLDLIGTHDRGWAEAKQKQVRQRVHLGFAAPLHGLHHVLRLAGQRHGARYPAEDRRLHLWSAAGAIRVRPLLRARRRTGWCHWSVVLAPVVTYVLATYSTDCSSGTRWASRCCW